MQGLLQQHNFIDQYIQSNTTTIDKINLQSISLHQFLCSLQIAVHKVKQTQLIIKMPKIIAIMRMISQQINEKQNQQQYIKFLKIITLLIAQFDNKFDPFCIRELINVYISKSAKINLLQISKPQQKLQQIKKWSIKSKQIACENSQQLCTSICSYIIQQVDLQNYQQALILFYFSIQAGLKLNENSILSFCYLLRKFMSNNCHSNKLMQYLSIKIISQLLNQPNINKICMKLYANCLIFIVQNCHTIEQVNQIYVHIHPFSIASSNFTTVNNNNKNQVQNRISIKQLNQQRQQYFVHLCKLYIETNAQIVIQSIIQLIKTGTTTMMVDNIWGFFNTDNYTILKSKQNIMRFSTILQKLRNYNAQINYHCLMDNKTSWFVKELGQKRPSVLVLQCQLLFPHELKDNQLNVICRLQCERGKYTIFIPTYTGTTLQKINFASTKKKYEIYLQKQSSKQRPQPILIGYTNYTQCNITIQLKQNNKCQIFVANQSQQINHSAIGRLNRVILGGKNEQINNAIKKIKSFCYFQELIYSQFVKQREQLMRINKNKFKIQKSSSIFTKLPQRKSQKQVRFNIFQYIEQIENLNNNQRKKEKSTLKHMDCQNILITKNRKYIDIVNLFGGKKLLIAQALCAIQQIKQQEILLEYVNLVKQQFQIFQFSKQDFCQIYFVSGFCLTSKKYESVAYALCQLIVSEQKISAEVQQTKYNEKKKVQLNQKIQMKLQLILQNILRGSKLNWKDKALYIVEQYWAINCDFVNHQQKCIESLNKLVKNLSFLLMKSINDWSRPNNQQFTYFNTGIRSSINHLSMQINPQNFITFAQTIKQAIIKIMHKTKYSIVISQSIMYFLHLILIILSQTAIKKNIYHTQYILTVLQQILQILQYLSCELCVSKNIHKPQKICQLLAQMYDILPNMSKFCQVKLTKSQDDQQFDQLFYEQFTDSKRNLQITADHAFILMQKYFYVGLQIGSFALKQKKFGFQTYINEVCNYLSDKFQNKLFKTHLQKQTKIALIQIYMCCWKFVLCQNNQEKNCKDYKFDLQTKNKLCKRLAQLNYPLYYVKSDSSKLFNNIFIFYIPKIPKAPNQLFPKAIFEHIQAFELQQILQDFLKYINKQKGQKKQQIQINLMKILNQFPFPLRYKLIEQKQIQQKSEEWKKIYRWSKSYNQIKRLNKIFKSAKQQKFNNMVTMEDQITQMLKGIFNQIKERIKNYDFCMSIQKIVNEFIENSSINEEDLKSLSVIQNYYSIINKLQSECDKINFNQFSTKYKKIKSNDNYEQKNSVLLQTAIVNKNEQNIKNKQPILGVSLKNKAKGILLRNSCYFLQLYNKLSKQKAMILLSYYNMMQRLSLAQKLFKNGNSNKYDQFEYYILDDYLNNENVKVMLKRDYSAILNNLISRDIPRLFDKKQVNQHQIFALKITQSLKNLNQTPYLEQIIQKQNKANENTKNKNSIVIDSYLVTKSKVYQGKITLNKSEIIFAQNTNINKSIYERLYVTQAEQRTQLEIAVCRKKIAIQIIQVTYSQKKKYLHKFPALEIYTAHFSYFFVFQKNEDCDKLLANSKILYAREKEEKQLIRGKSSQWQKGQMNNFQFIQISNRISGRSLNDLSQYYIFPWVVNIFKGILDSNFLSNQSNFRDLTKPIGTINSKKQQIVVSKYQTQISDSLDGLPPYMFGSFYSNPGVVSNFLLRVNPFTTHHHQLQGKQFDLFDRLFISMSDQYQSIFNVVTDNRELVPQFYCAPQFFRNRNQYNFAHKPEKDKINLKMKFPQWVISDSPQQFVFRMRKILQSKIVTTKLAHWIDLIFGYKSDLKYAAKFNNLYMPQLYQQKQSIKQIQRQQKQLQASELQVKAHMIKQFGQVPKNIFDKAISSLTQVEISQDIQKCNIKKLQSNIKNVEATNQQFVSDYYDSIMAVSSGAILSFFNCVQWAQEIIGLQQQLDQQLKCLSIMSINKTKYSLLFTLTLSGKLIAYTIKNQMKQSLLLSTKNIYVAKNKVHLFPQVKFHKVKTMGRYVIAVQENSLLILKVTNQQSPESTQLIDDNENQYYIKDNGYLFIHKSNIVNIQSYENLGIIVTIDESGLVNVFSLNPDVLVRATFKLNYLKSCQFVNKILISSMGILVLLTNFQQLLVYNIYGDSILRVKLDFKGVSDIQFWDNQASSQILILNKFGNLYKIQLFDMVKNKQECFSGVKISANQYKSKKISDKHLNSKIIMHRFGVYWKIYTIIKASQIYVLECEKDFNQTYRTRKILQNCNENAQYRNV